MAHRVGYGFPGNPYMYPLYTTSNTNPPQNSQPGYTPTPQYSSPPIPSEYTFVSPPSTGSYPETSAPPRPHEAPVNTSTEPDPSYSPRVPEYDGVSFDIPATTSSGYASAPSWEYQVNNGSSRYNAGDQYNPGGYSTVAPRWNYEQEYNQTPPASVSAYDQAPPAAVSGYDHKAPSPPVTVPDHHIAPGPPVYNQEVPPPSSGAWYNRETVSHTSGYDYRAPSYPPSGHENPYVERTSSANDYSGVYAYDGGNTQPYGAKGTGASSWNSDPLGDFPKLVKALPKIETEAKGSGIQKFHVKLLPESSTVGLPTNVICQIGLDGLRLLDPSSGRLLRIHPLESITTWDVNEPSTFEFWTKNGVDYEQRMTRLRSSRATTSAILDTLTAACVQLSEMVEEEQRRRKSSPSPATTEEQKKSFFGTWFNVGKEMGKEERDHWVPDEEVSNCKGCNALFTSVNRRHHCRNCGQIFCDGCSRGRTPLTSEPGAPSVRVCKHCHAEVAHRLAVSSKESTDRLALAQSHEDLAKKLKEEMERNASRKNNVESDKTTSIKSGQAICKCVRCGTTILGNMSKCPSCGLDSGRKGRNEKRTKEVACPTCTVHLEVAVPAYGADTVECGVCQHLFLVQA